ncbi:Sec-independent protein translocase protein TatB [Gordonia shandongensis]|uniref:Sec-independent protein translocase protein TatB n=1 Tax=Gordonia shandongensis TaxID=376351 RepID=UPI000407905C|nr:Sec-independent protein translocase protein TatB [Gordonia shandongensis]
MFSSVGWGELLILLVAALVILGPERLPGAVSWTMQSLKKVRDYATGASSQLRDELGDDFEQIREPLTQLNELRRMNPKSLVTQHLFDGDQTAVDDLGRQTRSVRDTFTSLGARPDSPMEQPAARSAAREPQPEITPADTVGRPSASPSAPDVSQWDAT